MFLGETRGERFLTAEPRQNNFFDGDRELAVYAVVLGQVAHSELGIARCAGRCESYFTGNGFEQSQNAFDKSGLTATVRTDNAQKIPVVNGKVYVAKHCATVVSGIEVSYFNNRFHC